MQTDGTTLVYLVRHGQTTLNAKNCYRGPMDIPLDGQGRNEVEEAADQLKNVAIYPVLITSDMSRTRETAKTIAKGRQGIAFRETRNLRALNLGHLAGHERTPETEHEIEEHADNIDLPFEGGESLREFKTRVHPILEGAIHTGLESGLPVVLAVHSSIVHEIGEILEGTHNAVLVRPGGIVQVILRNGAIHAEPVFKPDTARMKSRHDVIS